MGHELKWSLTKLAENDLKQIFEYTTNQWGLPQAYKYGESIEEKIVQLSNNPEIGRDLGYIKKGYSKIKVEKHFLIFRITKNEIIIVRILHQAMDLKRHL